MLITTRDERVAQRLAGIHASIVVQPMSPQEAQGLLEKWQTKPPGSLGSDHSKRLLEALEYIPLAITQAAAFIRENHTTLTRYLEVFRTNDSDLQDLLNEDLGDLRRDAQSHNSVIKTWKISFDMISKQKPRAAEILSLVAVLDRQGIPESLLRHDTDRNIDITTALGTLQAFSIISTGVDGVGYEIHRLVQLATRKWLEIQGKIEVWRERALLVLADMFPLGEFENWMTCESLLPHVQEVIQYDDARRKYPLEFSTLLSNVASFDAEQGRYKIACVKYLATFEITKNLLGLEDVSTLRNMRNLANTFSGQGRWEDAEKLHLQVLEARKRVLGIEHRDTLDSISNLANTYRQQGRWEEAETLDLQALKGMRRVLGIEHPDTLNSMSNLAATYHEQGRWEEAETLYLQALKARKRELGTEHPLTLGCMDNLAITYQKQGRWDEAETLYLQALEGRRRVLGAEHPHTLISMANLAILYRRRDRHGEAIVLWESVVTLRKKVLGANHPDTVDAVEWLKECTEET